MKANSRRDNVVYLPSSDTRLVRRRRLWAQMREAVARVAGIGRVTACAALLVVWQLVRLALIALLVLLEPLVRIVLVPLAFFGFLVTLLFGFAMGEPHFPKWGMLAFSVGALWLYWLYLGLLGLVMRLP
jgi:hypothetical protein